MKSTFKFVFLHSMINTDFKEEHRGQDVRFTEEARTVYDENIWVSSLFWAALCTQNKFDQHRTTGAALSGAEACWSVLQTLGFVKLQCCHSPIEPHRGWFAQQLEGGLRGVCTLLDQNQKPTAPCRPCSPVGIPGLLWGSPTDTVSPDHSKFWTARQFGSIQTVDCLDLSWSRTLVTRGCQECLVLASEDCPSFFSTGTLQTGGFSLVPLGCCSYAAVSGRPLGGWSWSRLDWQAPKACARSQAGGWVGCWICHPLSAFAGTNGESCCFLWRGNCWSCWACCGSPAGGRWSCFGWIHRWRYFDGTPGPVETLQQCDEPQSCTEASCVGRRTEKSSNEGTEKRESEEKGNFFLNLASNYWQLVSLLEDGWTLDDRPSRWNLSAIRMIGMFGSLSALNGVEYESTCKNKYLGEYFETSESSFNHLESICLVV